MNEWRMKNACNQHVISHTLNTSSCTMQLQKPLYHWCCTAKRGSWLVVIHRMTDVRSVCGQPADSGTLYMRQRHYNTTECIIESDGVNCHYYCSTQRKKKTRLERSEKKMNGDITQWTRFGGCWACSEDKCNKSEMTQLQVCRRMGCLNFKSLYMYVCWALVFVGQPLEA